MIEKITQCRICGNTNLVPIINLGIQSLTGVFPRSIDEKITSGPLELMKCFDKSSAGHCGLVQLGCSYNKDEMYGDNYGYRSGLNNSMVMHLKDIYSKILKIIDLKQDMVVLDIGSNDGTFLKMFPKDMGSLIGIDPTLSKFSKYYDSHIIQIADFFSSARIKAIIGARQASIVTSIAMFYDLDSPIDFALQVSDILADDGIWVLEQSYLPFMLKQNAYDTICHEHLEYYSLKQLKWIMDRACLKIIDVEYNDINGGSIKLTVAKLKSVYKECTDIIDRSLMNEEKDGLNTLEPFSKFDKNVKDHRDNLRNLMGNIRQKGELVIGYGASTKGNVILQYCAFNSKDIAYIAEINEDKYGLYTPNTHIPIISEEKAKKLNPQYFLVLPWHFKENFLKREASYLSNGGKLIFPLPKIEIIG